MANAYNFGGDDRKAGLSSADARVVISVIGQFMERFDEVYEGRQGTIVLDAQPTIATKCVAVDREGNLVDAVSMRSITYGEAKCLLRFDLPGGKAKSIFFDGDKVAEKAIDALLDGTRFFAGHQNASLNGNIYKTSGTNKTYESGHLLILNALFGRFLVGCGDSKADSDKRREHDFIFIALARILAQMFPKDTELQASFDWVRRASNMNYYLCDTVIDQIDTIFQSQQDYRRTREEEISIAAKSPYGKYEPLPFV